MDFPPPQYGGPPKRNRGPLLVIGVLVLVLVVVLVAGVVVLLRISDSNQSGSTPTTKPAPEAVQFRRIVKTEPGACATTSATTTTPDGTACGSDGVRYTLGKVELDGSRVSEVKAALRDTWYVGLSLDQEGARLFDRLTTDLAAQTPPQNQLAIVIHGRVVTAPTVSAPITGGKVEITGNFTKKDAEKLVAEITG